MIKVYFPPGCYGTYVSRCIYNYSNLRTEPFVNFEFDINGSSHTHRKNLSSKPLIKAGHLSTMPVNKEDSLIVVVPCVDHKLDYYNNQFFKQQQGHLIGYILNQLSYNDIKIKLKDHWRYTGEFDNSVPRWIMREWCSFWIDDFLKSSYENTPYHKLDSVLTITTLDIFENWIFTITKIISSLNLTLAVEKIIIEQQHQKFLEAQKFHNSQTKCHWYVDCLIANKEETLKVNSIFDEAYIQHLLRKRNIEIKCNGLDTFPSTVQELSILTYENSNHNN